MSGILHLLPVPLGPAPLEYSLPPHALALAQGLDYFVAENAKTARAFLKAAGVTRPLREIEIRELNEHTPPAAVPDLLAPILSGRDGALVSEAGCPAVADPGALLVHHAHERGIRVHPMVGPSSLLLALMASGLEGQRFAFHGYLPASESERVRAIRALEEDSRRNRRSEIFIETPYRAPQVLSSLLAHCAVTTRLCVAADLTLAGEMVNTRRIADWRAAPPDLRKKPTVFLIQAD